VLLHQGKCRPGQLFLLLAQSLLKCVTFSQLINHLVLLDQLHGIVLGVKSCHVDLVLVGEDIHGVVHSKHQVGDLERWDLVTAAEVVVAVGLGIATAGLDSQHPDVGVLPGDGDLDTMGGEGAVSADIHIETDGFLAEDAGVGVNHSVAGDFTGVENSHKQSG
jgi:hypothetical protein